ncbi:MAG: RlmE family RNA methyltransferase [Nitrosopumilus sp.]|nr:RlmE family RNA methyltransferase [Nitrosopumilus sp.]
MKLSDARKDQYRKLAKENMYRSRAVYKLSQLNNSYHFLKEGMKIVDIGAAPGGWLQFASKVTGPSGTVIGIDLKEIEPLPNVTTIVGNIEDKKDVDRLIKAINGKVDVVLSDLAPNVSGLWKMDHVKQIDMTTKALEFTKIVLKENGYALYKVFQGEDTTEFINYLKKFFLNVIITKPDASRKQSSEIYVLCKRYNKKDTT